MTFAPR